MGNRNYSIITYNQFYLLRGGLMNAHSKFRTTKRWKEFRYELLFKCGNECQLCGTQYKGKRTKMLQVHHLRPSMYEELRPELFKVVCSECHSLIERMSIKKTWGKYKELWKCILIPFLDEEIKNKLEGK